MDGIMKKWPDASASQKCLLFLALQKKEERATVKPVKGVDAVIAQHSNGSTIYKYQYGKAVRLFTLAGATEVAEMLRKGILPDITGMEVVSL